MIRSSAIAACLSLIAALAVHGAGGVSFLSQEQVEIEASAGAQETALGSSFKDMAAGTLTPQDAQDVTEPVKPEPRPPETQEPEKTQAEVPQETPPQQTVQETPKPTKPDVFKAQKAQPAAPSKPAQTPTVTPTQTARLLQSSPTQPVMAKPIETPLVESADAAMPMQSVTLAPQISQAVQPTPLVSSEIKPVDAISPAALVQPSLDKPDVIKRSNDGPVMAVTRSSRPKRRSKELEARAAKAKPKTRSGNASRSARKGTASGSRKKTAARKGSNGRKKQSGNAAASNYPGRVMARIQSVGRPSVSARGTARVRFSVTSSGGLSSVTIVRSSGSRRLDNAAANIIYSASPFPRPPAGARRTFSINISGR